MVDPKQEDAVNSLYAIIVQAQTEADKIKPALPYTFHSVAEGFGRLLDDFMVYLDGFINGEHDD